MYNWSLFGGYLEYGEMYVMICLWEYKEDSGIDVEVVDCIGIFDKGEMVYFNGDVV